MIASIVYVVTVQPAPRTVTIGRTVRKGCFSIAGISDMDTM